MIFLTGATGLVGSGLLARLAEQAGPARALAHSGASRQVIESQGAEAVDGDLDRPETLGEAMVGCDQMFLLSPPHPDQAAREKAAIDAAARAGVGHVVALSVTGANASSPVAFAAWHGEIDDHLVASGLEYTILRPAAYMQSHLWPVATVRDQGRWFGMTGDGPASYIDADDVGAAAAGVLTGRGDRGTVYELTGPAALSMPEAAAQLSDVLGRPVEYVDVPADQFRAGLLGAGLPDWIADALVALYQQFRAGHAATVTHAVQELTGRPPRSYRQFAEAHERAFVDS